jgi:hypothetical protein
MSNNSNSSSGGIGLLNLIGVTFVALKLTSYIDWSWWWVTAPFWVWFELVVAIRMIIGLTQLIKEI